MLTFPCCGSCSINAYSRHGLDFGYNRTSRRLQEEVAGIPPMSQELQVRRAGVPLDEVRLLVRRRRIRIALTRRGD